MSGIIRTQGDGQVCLLTQALCADQHSKGYGGPFKESSRVLAAVEKMIREQGSKQSVMVRLVANAGDLVTYGSFRNLVDSIYGEQVSDPKVIRLCRKMRDDDRGGRSCCRLQNSKSSPCFLDFRRRPIGYSSPGLKWKGKKSPQERPETAAEGLVFFCPRNFAWGTGKGAKPIRETHLASFIRRMDTLRWKNWQ